MLNGSPKYARSIPGFLKQQKEQTDSMHLISQITMYSYTKKKKKRKGNHDNTLTITHDRYMSH